MSDLIEWEEVGNGGWRGKVGGRILLALTPTSEVEYGVWLFNDGVTITSNTLEGAKNKGDEELQRWLKEAGLVEKPALNKCNCDRCTGDDIEKYYRDGVGGKRI